MKTSLPLQSLLKMEIPRSADDVRSRLAGYRSSLWKIQDGRGPKNPAVYINQDSKGKSQPRF
jgi:hypothetical protein